MDIHELSASELANQYASGQLSTRDVVSSYLERIDSLDQSIGAYLEVMGESAMAQAESIDKRRAQGKALGRLAGIPISIKNLICIEGTRTTCASKMLEDYVPPYDATVISRLRAADAILLGTTNLDEFAMGSSTENSAFRVTGNPWDLSRSPGGSSGGSAASVAARLTPLSLGTDTGGSIRQPAGLVGVIGLKPTYGRVSRYGLVAFASSLDQIGPFARSIDDLALCYEVIAGFDERDSTSAPEPVTTPQVFPGSLSQRPLEGLRLGRLVTSDTAGVLPQTATAIDAACRTMEDLGAVIEDVQLPHLKYGVATYYVIAPSEASANLARYDGCHYGYRSERASSLNEIYELSRSEGFGPEVKRRIMLGTYALSEGYYDAFYLKALRVRRLIRDDFEQAFRRFDILLGPTSPATAFRLGEKSSDPLSMYLEDVFTVPANLAGIPAISIPCGFDSTDLPIGLHLQAATFQEHRLMEVAAAYQRATDWHKRSPQI